jgi:hypothetical protein
LKKVVARWSGMRHDLSVSKGEQTMSNEIYARTLCDSNTNATLSAEDLGLTEEQYDAMVEESIDSKTAEGHVRAPNGRKVYAPFA